jgi:cytochrome c553
MKLKKTPYLLTTLLITLFFSASHAAEKEKIEESNYSTQDLIEASKKADKLFNLEEHDYDKYTGDEINQVCAGCHDEFGMGGKDGKYPRIAGLPTKYILKQILLFRERMRPNIPMLQHVEERELPNDELMDIAIYLNKIKLNNRLSKIDETAPDFDAYARLQEAKSIIQIGKSEGNIKKGKKLYKECKSCHGKHGNGDQEEALPRLSGQYTKYLWRQIDMFKSGKRLHDEEDLEEEFFKSFSHEDLENLLAYISTLDD